MGDLKPRAFIFSNPGDSKSMVKVQADSWLADGTFSWCPEMTVSLCVRGERENTASVCLPLFIRTPALLD